MDLQENPLVPNKKLRQMYGAMVEARVLDEHVARAQKRVGRDRSAKGRHKLDSIRGEEACRVSLTIDLGPGDLVSDSQDGVVMELLAGAKIDSLLKRVEEFRSGKKVKTSRLSSRVLPWIEDAGERLRMAMGAALSFKTLRQTNVVVAYVRGGEVAKGEWRRLLELAAKLELPIIFVMLPGAGRTKQGETRTLSAKCARWGVPGIPVDADDAVALYRVAQESMGRTRGGDGPVLIECVARRMKGSGATKPVDALVQMEGFLLRRKVCSRAWLKCAGEGLRRKIAAARQ